MNNSESGFTGTYIVGSFLRAVDGTGLSSNANLTLAGDQIAGNNALIGGVLETSGNFTRSLGSGAGQIQIGSSQGNYSGVASPPTAVRLRSASAGWVLPRPSPIAARRDLTSM